MDTQNHNCFYSGPPSCRPLSTLSPYMFRSATDADTASGDSVSLARSISKDSLASNVVNVTPKHQSSAHQPGAAAAVVHRLNGHSMLSNVNIEDEEEETLTVSRTDSAVRAKQADEMQAAAAAAAAATVAKPPSDSKPAAGGFYLEPLMPAVLKTAKEKSVCLNKEEESGEGPHPSVRGSQQREGFASADRRKAPRGLNQTFPPPGEDEQRPTECPRDRAELRPVLTGDADPPSKEVAGGFYLHTGSEEPQSGQNLDVELQDLDEEEEELDEAVTTKDPNWSRKDEDEEEESAKLQEDMNVKEHEDKDMNGSGRSSPCLSTHSQASSVASGGVRMTSFAERRAQQQRFGSNHDLRSSASSSQRTTPDGSESSGPLASSWRLKRDQSPSSPLGGGQRLGDGATNVLASEIVQLRMQLEEKRRAIEHQKKKMEVLSARQRQKLGKAAFLHIVKKGGGRSDTLPNPLKADISKDELSGEKAPTSRDDSFVSVLKGDKEAGGTPTNASSPAAFEADNRGNGGSFYLEEELDLNECSRSIELLNDAISSIQQQMMQLSAQQEVLMKQNLQSPPGVAPPLGGTDAKATAATFHYVEHLSNTSTASSRKPPKLSSGRRPKSKPSELKLKEHERHSSRSLTPTQSGPETLRQSTGGRSPRAEPPDSPRKTTRDEAMDRPGAGHARSASFRLHDEANIRLPTRVDLAAVAALETTSDQTESKPSERQGRGSTMAAEEVQRNKSQLIEVDLSELKAPEDGEAGEDTTTEGSGEQKPLIGFFFKVTPLF